MQAKRCVPALRCRQSPASGLRSPPARDKGNLPLPELVKRAILTPKISGNLANVGQSPSHWAM